MIKKLSMVVLGAVMATFIMAAVPQVKAEVEAAVVYHQVYHYGPNGERGYTTIRVGNQYSGPNYFSIWLNYGFTIHWASPTGYGYHYCRMNCGKGRGKYQNIPWYGTIVRLNV